MYKICNICDWSGDINTIKFIDVTIRVRETTNNLRGVVRL
jgi:hypothetical protein